MPKVVLFFDDKLNGVVFYPSPGAFQRIKDTLEDGLQQQMASLHSDPNMPDGAVDTKHKCDGIPCSMCDTPACSAVIGESLCPQVGEMFTLGVPAGSRHVTITMPDGASVQIPYSS